MGRSYARFIYTLSGFSYENSARDLTRRILEQEAPGKHLAEDVFDSFSAGTETKPQINEDAVRLMKEITGNLIKQ